jgi:hypothetical protein
MSSIAHLLQFASSGWSVDVVWLQGFARLLPFEALVGPIVFQGDDLGH